MVLKDKIALITGGSSGIGAAIARLFAKEGARVILTYRSNESEARELVEELSSTGCLAVCLQADLGREADVKRLFQEIKDRFGKLDILINNAGRTFNVAFQDLTEASIRRDLDTNLVSTMLCSHCAVELMGEQGWIVNTTSIRGMTDSGRPGIMGYCAAKAGVISFTKNLALELAPRVCVNAVAPGFVYTQYMEKNVSDELKESWRSQIPLGRFVDIQELAKVYLFLATTQVMTGTVLPVDGGYTILNR